jgi:hypothetical protein
LLCLLACCCCWAPPSRGVRPPALVSWPAALAVCCALANDDKLTSKSLRQSGAWRPHVDLPASSLKKEGVACHWHERTTPDLLTPSQHMAAMRAVTPACPHPFRAVQQLPRACRAIGHDDPRRYGAQTSNLWSTRVLGVRLLLRGGFAYRTLHHANLRLATSCDVLFALLPALRDNLLHLCLHTHAHAQL